MQLFASTILKLQWPKDGNKLCYMECGVHGVVKFPALTIALVHTSDNNMVFQIVIISYQSNVSWMISIRICLTKNVWQV